MASILHLMISGSDLREEIKRRDDFAELSRREKFIAARKIQAWFRGILTRNHFRILHKNATIIQCHWRGYRDRILMEFYLIERVHQMWQDYYDRMATRIQALWRGYWIRKTCLDIQKAKSWLKDVYRQNEETLENMRKFRENEIGRVKNYLEHESMRWILFILFKLHHLLGTKHRPGVFTRIDRTHFTSIEEMLKCLEYDLYVPKGKSICENCQIDPGPSLVFRGTYFERCEREIREFEKSVQSGSVPIFRSESYEKREKIQRKINNAHRDILTSNRYEAKLSYDSMKKLEENEEICSLKKNSISTEKLVQKTRCPFIESNLQSFCIEPNDFCNQIRKMDCYLDQVGIKCPIHHLKRSPIC